MAKAVINLQKESGGIVKISPVDGIGITEVTVPESGTLATEEYVNSEIGVPNSPLVKTALNATGDAPIYACRAWVNFNGTGTVAIRASGNVSSVTDNRVGDYTVNFTTAMPDSNFSAITSCDERNVEGDVVGNHNTTSSTSTHTATSFRLYSMDFGQNIYIDSELISAAVFR